MSKIFDEVLNNLSQIMEPRVKQASPKSGSLEAIKNLNQAVDLLESNQEHKMAEEVTQVIEKLAHQLEDRFLEQKISEFYHEDGSIKKEALKQMLKGRK